MFFSSYIPKAKRISRFDTATKIKIEDITADPPKNGHEGILYIEISQPLFFEKFKPEPAPISIDET